MVTTLRSRGTPVFLMLFALPFIGIGVFMGGLTLRTLDKARMTSHWPEVPATLLSADLQEHHGDDSTTYRVTARYRYEVNGNVYESDRVGLHGGSDNLGHWQQERYADLQQVQRGERRLTCRVNPADPREAILFPQLRTGMLFFYGAFVLMFGGVGLGLFLAGARALRRRSFAAAAPSEEPWQQRREWAEGVIKSSSRMEAWALTFMAVVWNSVAWGMVVLKSGEILKQGGLSLIFFIFPVIGVFLAAWAVRAHLVDRRYGRAVFQMAPVPGVLGGRLAGLIRLPEAARPPDGFVVTVKCMRTTRSGKSTHTTVVWQDERRMNPEALPLVDTGQALPVLFALPYGLPASETWEGGGRISWRLEVKGRQPGVDVDLNFHIPVFQTADSRPDFVLDEKPISAYELKAE